MEGPRGVRWLPSVALLLVFCGWAPAAPGCASKHPRPDTATPEATADEVDTATEPIAPVPDERAVEVMARPLFREGTFAAARTAFETGRYEEAASGFAAGLTFEDPERTPEQAYGASFLKGLAELRGGDFAAASQTLSALVDKDALLNGYAVALAADAALQAGELERALELARATPEEALVRSLAVLVIGLATAEKGEHEAAITHLEGALADLDRQEERRALLAIARSYTALERYEDAAKTYQKLQAGHRNSSEGRTGARELEALAPKLPKAARPSPDTPDKRFVRAKALFSQHRSEQAIKALLAARKETKRAKELERWCEATYLVGKSYTKLRQHDDASKYYDEAVRECEQASVHMQALYNAGKAHWNAGRGDAAIDRFAKLATTYHDQSYADDALFLTARVRFDRGENELALQALRTQLAAYPDGDMAKDAHWKLLRELYTAGKFAETIRYVDANESHAGEDDLYTRGRLAYFRARALEQSGDTGAAIKSFEDVVRRFPLSYYALLAYGRLLAVDADAARTLTAELRSGPYRSDRDHVLLDPPELATRPSFQRGLHLLRLGLVDWARAELDTLAKANAEEIGLRWALAALYDAAGATTVSHRLAAEMATGEPVYFGKDTRAHWALAYPRPFLWLVEPAAITQSLRVELVYAIMREESGFDPKVESWANARGLMQLMLPTAQSVAPLAGVAAPQADDLFVPDQAIPLGAAYLGKLAGRYAGHPVFVVAGYNGGQGNVGRWLEERGNVPIDLWVEDIPYGQTRDYTKRVLTTYWRYLWLYSDAVGDGWSADPAQPAGEGAGVQ